MEEVFNLYKKRGETPLMRIERFREKHPDFKNISLSYAGRLDPLAEGVLLVVRGTSTVREKLLLLPKEYELEVLFGFATDSYDLLGVITQASERTRPPRVETARFLEELPLLVGEREQRYPPFSSKPLRGEPLFIHARRGGLAEKDIPTHTITIHSATLLGMRTLSTDAVRESVMRAVESVSGDFRQEKIRAVWEDALRVLYGMQFPVAKVRIVCSHGTYMRSVADELGKMLGIPALAFHIVRTKVGEYLFEKSEQ
jgi:tRNA pseudouridine55 synthase